jgi:hypothetical protein
MLTSAPILVHVVNEVDWPAIAAAAATFLAAAIGIGGTAWQAKRGREAASADLAANLKASTDNLRLGIDADRDHARDALKRQVYAVYLASIDRMELPMRIQRIADVTKGRLGTSTYAELKDLRTAADVALSELRLIASAPVASQAELLRAATERAALSDPGPAIVSIGEHYKILCNAMRSDLGEPPLPLDQGGTDPVKSGGV